jgi:serine/threonine protein kinase
MPDEIDASAETNRGSHSLRELLAEDPGQQVLDAALRAQRENWMSGQRTPALQWLRQYPVLASNPLLASEIVYHEFVLRQEQEESPEWEDYLREFPQYIRQLQLLYQADQIVEQALGTSTPTPYHPTPPEDYQLLEEIGRGGMAIVFKARQRSLDRIVALKMIRTGDHADADERRRFNREAQAVARLQHPNIVQIYEVGKADGQPFLALEFVHGQSLARHLNGTPLPPRLAASLIEVLARAMHYAHGQGVVHRDLKPANILMSGQWRVNSEERIIADAAAHPQALKLPTLHSSFPTPKITDFGLAKRLDSGADTRSGAILGTPSYMAPEQVESGDRPIDLRTDVYGLGSILYELITGRAPFRAESPLRTLQQVVKYPPARPRHLNRAVPRDLETVCLKCLEKEPSRRYDSAEALAEDLRRFADGQPVRARPIGAIGRASRWCRRNPAAAGLIFAVAAGLVASLLLWRQAVSNESRALAGEAQALTSLRKEESARQEADEHYARLQGALQDSIRPWFTRSLLTLTVEPQREATLIEAESCLSFLLERRAQDDAVRRLLTHVLSQLGALRLMQHRDAEAQELLERATALWERLRVGKAADIQDRAWHAITHICLERVNDRLAQPDRAQRSFETAIRIWRDLLREPLDPQAGIAPVAAGVDIAWALIRCGSTNKEVPRRLRNVHGRLKELLGPPECDLFFDLARLGYWHCEAEVREPFGHQVDALSLARDAARVVNRLLPRTDIPWSIRCHLACIGLDVSMDLRRGPALQEALAVSRLVNATLQSLLQGAAEDPFLLEVLGKSWIEVAKVYWNLKETEEAVTACRHALDVQCQLCLLVPGSLRYREDLGIRYTQLGRRLCELGRLDEAEACFSERQALWPGDAGKHVEALRILRKWAAQVGEDRNDLSPAERQEQQRYLELCARLERKGCDPAVTSASPAP